MTWLEVDDGILDHPKFIRAVKLGGSEAVHLWLGIKAYCNKQLTDGFIPTDMLDEVRGPKDPKKRAIALEALRTAKLLDDAEGGLQMHDYLEISRSRKAVLEGRRKNAERQSRLRGNYSPSNVSSNGVTDSVTTKPVASLVNEPSPLLTSPDPDPNPNQGESTHASAQDSWDGSERETMCPLDLGTRAKALKIPEQLAESLKVDLGAVEQNIREFVGYWTIGAGMGQKRRHWMRKLREHVRRSAGKPGGLSAPGALEHQQRNGANPNVDHDARRALEASRRVRELQELK